MNIDFGLDPAFSAYTLFLIATGIVMIALGFIKAAHQRTSARITNLVTGLLFLGYGIYLGFIFTGMTYFRANYVFLVPVMLVISFVRALRARRQRPVPSYTGTPTTIPGQYGQMAPYTQPDTSETLQDAADDSFDR